MSASTAYSRPGMNCSTTAGTIADDENAVEWTIGGGLEDRGHRRVLVVEADRDGAVLPGILDQMAAVGREHELHAEARGRVAKRARLIAGRRREDENTRHIRATCSAFGSAQQYQGSFRYGTVARSRAGFDRRPARGTRARSCASALTASNTASRFAVSRVPMIAITSSCSASTRGSGCVHR